MRPPGLRLMAVGDTRSPCYPCAPARCAICPRAPASTCTARLCRQLCQTNLLSKDEYSFRPVPVLFLRRVRLYPSQNGLAEHLNAWEASMATIEDLMGRIEAEARREAFSIDTVPYAKARRDPFVPILLGGQLNTSVAFFAR